MKNLPNIISAIRILMTMIIIAMMYTGKLGIIMAFMLFVVAGVSDFLDGYIARRFGIISKLGTILDPIADKILIASLLLALADLGAIHGWTIVPAIIIIFREFIIASIREFCATQNFTLAVSSMGKLKTVLQIVAVGFLILKVAYPIYFAIPAGVAFWLAGLITMVSAIDYMRSVYRYL